MTDAMDAIRPLLRVRNVRGFTDEPVRADALAAIADAARWSGSSQNSQPWRFITITSAEPLRALAALATQARGLSTARYAIAIAMPSIPGRGISLAYDEGRAAERMLIAARLLDLDAGISWLPEVARERAGQLLGLPEDRSVRTIVAVGHASDAASQPKSRPGDARLPREDVVFSERWPEGNG
jgi:nitroreductase